MWMAASPLSLPARVAVLGEEQVAARPELEVAADRHAHLAAEAPGVILEVAADARADGDRAVEERRPPRRFCACGAAGASDSSNRVHECDRRRTGIGLRGENGLKTTPGRRALASGA